MKKIILILSLLVMGSIASSQSVVEYNYDGVSSKKNPASAQRDIYSKASKEISKKLIIQVIGEEKYAANTKLIEQKIIRKSNKYVLYTKGGKLSSEGGKSTMTVNLKLSMKALNKLLSDQGLLFKSDTEARILPLITFTDNVSSVDYRWWAMPDTESRLARRASSFHQSLREQLFDKGFYGIRPVRSNSYEMIGDHYHRSQLSPSQKLSMARDLSANMLVTGDVKWMQQVRGSSVYKISAKLQVIHVSNGRVIAEVVRNYNTAAGPAVQVIANKFEEVQKTLTKALVAQVYGSWSKGTLSTNLVKLTVLGPLSYKQIYAFKALMKSQLSGVRSVKERNFEPQKTVFEMNALSSPKQLAEGLKTKDFPGFKVTVDSVTDKSIQVDVVAR